MHTGCPSVDLQSIALEVAVKDSAIAESIAQDCARLALSEMHDEDSDTLVDSPETSALQARRAAEIEERNRQAARIIETLDSDSDDELPDMSQVIWPSRKPVAASVSLKGGIADTQQTPTMSTSVKTEAATPQKANIRVKREETTTSATRSQPKIAQVGSTSITVKRETSPSPLGSKSSSRIGKPIISSIQSASPTIPSDASACAVPDAKRQAPVISNTTLQMEPNVLRTPTASAPVPVSAHPDQSASPSENASKASSSANSGSGHQGESSKKRKAILQGGRRAAIEPTIDDTNANAPSPTSSRCAKRQRSTQEDLARVSRIKTVTFIPSTHASTIPIDSVEPDASTSRQASSSSTSTLSALSTILQSDDESGAKETAEQEATSVDPPTDIREPSVTAEVPVASASRRRSASSSSTLSVLSLLLQPPEEEGAKEIAEEDSADEPHSPSTLYTEFAATLRFLQNQQGGSRNAVTPEPKVEMPPIPPESKPRVSTSASRSIRPMPTALPASLLPWRSILSASGITCFKDLKDNVKPEHVAAFVDELAAAFPDSLGTFVRKFGLKSALADVLAS